MDWDNASHYDVLHVAENAPASVIRASFKALMQAHHPDRHSGPERLEAERIAARLNAAMDVLGDPAQRRNYDERLSRQRAKGGTTGGQGTSEPPNGTGNHQTSQPPRASQKVRPWPRFWARCIDYSLFSIPFAWVFSSTVNLDPALANNGVFWSLLIAGAWIPVEALFVSTFGTTLGKRIFRISIIDERGVPSFFMALRRSINVWWQGAGFAAPLISTIANIVAYFDLQKSGNSSWDRKLSLKAVQGDISTFRSVATGTATLITMLFLMLLTKSIDKIETPSINAATTQCAAPAIWDPWKASCETPKQAAAAPIPTPVPVPTEPVDLSAEFLAMGVDVLDQAGFEQGSSKWLSEHSQYNNANDIAIIQSHLNEVLSLYPHIELRAALDMALQRALAASRAPQYASPSPPPSRWEPDTVASPGPYPAIQEGSASRSDYSSTMTPEVERIDAARPMPLNSVDIPSWEAIKTGRANQRVNPVDPSKVVPVAPGSSSPL